MKNFNLTTDNKTAKVSIKDFCKDYAKQIDLQFNAMKQDNDTKDVIKAMNITLCKDALKEGVNLATFYILHYSKFITKDGIIAKKCKDANGNIYYKARLCNGNTAKGILKDALINAIESCRKGNKFNQSIVTISNE